MEKERENKSSKVKSAFKFLLSPLYHIGRSFLYFFLFVFYLFLFGSLFEGYFQANLESLKLKGPIIAKISFEGVITEKTAKDLIKKLKKAENYNQTKAILLEIDSPGGAIGPTQEIYYELLHIKREKHIPIVAFLKSIAASGGYYISLPADKIVALPGTLTGSIGVFTQWIYVGDLLKKLGIDVKIIKAGKYKDILNPFSKPVSYKIDIINQTIQDSYKQFLEAVSKNRKLPLTKVEKLAQGKIYTGRMAKNVGLVDYVGDYYFALNITRELSKTPNAKVVEIKLPKNPFSQMFEEGQTFLGRLKAILMGKGGVEIYY